MAVDYSTDVGKVRLLIADTDDSVAANLLFTDTQIETFLTLESDNVKMAAAQALETLATNETMLLKRIQVRGGADVSTDGPAVGRELRLQAKQLREQAQDDGAFAVAEMVQTADQLLERRLKQEMKS